MQRCLYAPFISLLASGKQQAELKSMRKLYTIVVAGGRWTHLTTIGADSGRDHENDTIMQVCVRMCMGELEVGTGNEFDARGVRREESIIAYMLNKAGISQAYFR